MSGVLVLALAWGQARAADDVDPCTGLNDLIAEAQLNFSDGPALARDTVPLASSDADDCSVRSTLSGVNVHLCTWAFTYRDTGALDAFETLDRAVRDCFPGSADMRKDQGVNHPDYYELRQYEVRRVGLSVSIKDKSAHGKTYVFLRTDGLAQE